MDLLRSCYGQLMDMGDGAQGPYKIKWYFTPDDAPYYPGFHLFGSGNWDPEGPTQLGPGESPKEKPVYVKGTAPGNPVPGAQPCGDPSWFVNGVPPGTPRLALNGQGLPICCYGGLPPPPPCIPWKFTLFPDTRNATVDTNPSDWSEFLRNQSDLWYENTVTADDIVRFQGVGLACPPGDRRVRAQLLHTVSGPTTIVNMTCIGYDHTTETSLWLIPLTAPIFAGQIWTFVCPTH